jgi:hypothetical protein
MRLKRAKYLFLSCASAEYVPLIAYVFERKAEAAV